MIGLWEIWDARRNKRDILTQSNIPYLVKDMPWVWKKMFQKTRNSCIEFFYRYSFIHFASKVPVNLYQGCPSTIYNPSSVWQPRACTRIHWHKTNQVHIINENKYILSDAYLYFYSYCLHRVFFKYNLKSRDDERVKKPCPCDFLSRMC